MPMTEDVQSALVADDPLARGQALWQIIWEPLSIFGLVGYSLAGVFLGFLLGILIAWFLQRNGWLNRKNRWHHWLLKLYFLLLPLGGVFIGSQAGLIYGSQQQINRYVDTYTPALHEIADGTWQNFREYLAQQNLETLGTDMQQHSIQDVLFAQSQAYMKAQYAQYLPLRDEASFVQRYGFMLMERLQESYLRKAITEVTVDKTASFTFMDKDVIAQAMQTPVSQLFQGEYLAGLLKQQISALYRPFYLTLWMQLALMLAIIVIEAVASHYTRQMRKDETASPSALPQT